VTLEDAVRVLEQVEPVAGRLQMIRRPGCPLVVDRLRAHADALEKVLETLPGVLGGAGRLICVFGCGGERDPGKRPHDGRDRHATCRSGRHHQR
jgi:UDP-N-acetylmuramoyl-L-alanyl-D-glutamate--2,6-diaminopimelate ligase